MTPPSGTRVELWVEPRRDMPAVNPTMHRLLAALNAAGIAASACVPEHASAGPGEFDLRASPDLVLLKTATSFGLSMAVAQEARGGRFYNGALASLRAGDKALTVALLAAAGLPVPPTYATAGAPGARLSAADRAAQWVSKPVRGVHGAGVEMHLAFPDQMGAAGAAAGPFVVDDGVRLVQRRVGGDAVDVKVYVAGSAVFAGRKRFGPSSFTSDEIEPVALDSRAREVVLGAGAALGLRCFGVDLRYEGAEPYVIDVNPFPGFRGFPESVPALMEEIRGILAGGGREGA